MPRLTGTLYGMGREARNKACFIITVISVLLSSEICFGFDDGDFQYWSSGGVSFDIDKDWKFTFSEELRYGDDAGHLYYHHSDVGVVYKSFADWIDLGVNYRGAFGKDSKGEWRRINGPHFNITLKSRLFGLDLSNRGRFQYYDRENERDFWRYRNKVTVKFPQELTRFKIQPYLADEVFLNFGEGGYNRNRLYSGVSFRLSSNIKGGVFYLWQSSKSGGDWKDINVLGFNVKFYF